MRFSSIIICITMSFFSISLFAQDFHRAACQGDLKRLDSLSKTVDINLKNGTGSTALHIAIYCRQEEAFDFLIEQGAVGNIENKFGETALSYAASTANLKMVKVLLERGSNVNVINEDNHTPIFNAVRSNNIDLFNALIEAGADVNMGLSSLHKATLNENLEMIKKLINEETNVDILNDYENTPLSIALRQGNNEIAEFLIVKGADLRKVKKYSLEGEYLGQEKPSLEAQVFAKNFVSTEDFNHTPAFSPDSKEFYYTLESRKYGATIMVSRLESGKWSKPIAADIEGEYREIDPFITKDGSKLFYCSNRPKDDSDTETNNIDMWMVEKEGKGWGQPQHLGNEVNTPDADWFPTISDKGTLFFSTGPGRNSNIVYSELRDGKYQKSIVLSDSVNSESRDYDPLIAPDESYVIFSSNRPNGFGSVDLYISFKKEDGSWSKAKNMGDKVNSSIIEFAPKISNDGKFLFFNRGGDIYWISSEVINSLR